MSRQMDDLYFVPVDADGNLPRPRFFTDELDGAAGDYPEFRDLLVDAGYTVMSGECLMVDKRWFRGSWEYATGLGFVVHVSLHDPTDPRYDGEWVISGVPDSRFVVAHRPEDYAEVSK